MKRNTFFIIIFILIVLTFTGYGYYRLFVVPNLPPVTQQPEIVLVGSYEFSSFGINSLSVQGKYLYMAEEKGINILDISDPSIPTPAGSYMVHRAGSRFGGSWEAPKDIYLSDDYIYIIVPSGLEIANISNPQKPEFTGYYGTFEKFGATTRKLSVVDNYLFLGTDFGLFIIDVSNPQKPILVGRYGRNLSIYSIFVVSNDYLYLRGHLKNTPAEEDYRFHIVDISDKSNPVAVKKYKEEVIPLVLQVTNHTAYALSSSFTKSVISIVDLSDPENPILTGKYEKEISYVSLYILDQYLRKTSNEGILSINISDLDKYTPIKGLPETLGTFTASGSYIYSVIQSPDKYATSILQIFEIKHD
ncbi:MAG: LVIVD repeat-containing protein [Methanosarcinales archaeon]